MIEGGCVYEQTLVKDTHTVIKSQWCGTDGKKEMSVNVKRVDEDS